MAGGDDGWPDSQAQETADAQPGVPLTPHPARTGATRRQALHDRERQLLDQERRLLDKGSHAVGWVRVTAAGTFWSRLNAVDFMNSSLQFAALAVLCLFPFLVIFSAESGGDARHALIARLGLDQEAARDVNQLMSSGTHAAKTLGIVGAAVVVLGAMGIASTLQVWYQRVYDQPPAQKVTRQLANRLVWLGGLLGYLTVQDFTFIHLQPLGAARVPIYIATFVLAVGLLLVDPPRPAARQGGLEPALPRSRRDGCMRDRPGRVFGPPVLRADRVKLRAVRVTWRGDDAVVLPDRARCLHPPGRCRGSHVE